MQVRDQIETGSRAVPIYQTSYVFRDSDAGAAMFNIERGGHVYSRISNPTTAVLEERISALEGGVGAVATSSVKQPFTTQLRHWSIRADISLHLMHCMVEHITYWNTHCLDLESLLLLWTQMI